jgi:hypothetical protein
MDFQIEEIDLDEKLRLLNLAMPQQVAFFPENLSNVNDKGEFEFAENLTDLKKIFKSENIQFEIFGGNKEKVQIRKNADIYLPAIFFGSLVSENSPLVSICLNVLSNYVYDILKGSFGKKTVGVEFYYEAKEKGKYKKISYKGDADGLKSIEKIIKNS